MKKIILIIILSIFSGSLFAQKPFKNKPDKNIIMHERIIQKLNLTEDQLKKLNQIKFSFEENRIELFAKLQKNRLEMKKMVKSSEINNSELLKLTEEGSRLSAELDKSRTKMWLDIYDILDDEQKIIWTENFGENNFMTDKRCNKMFQNFKFGERKFRTEIN